MAGQGRLLRKTGAGIMPLDAPLYAKPPIYYEGAESLGFTYETDAEAALDMLPDGLEVTKPAIATVLFLTYPFSTLGPYEEAILGISCLWQGKPRFYIPHIAVNSDIPQAAGREIWGYPKKFACIMLGEEGDLHWGRMERPEGNPIVSGVMRPEKPVAAAPPGPPVPGLSLRVIPSPEEGAPPSLIELIETVTRSTTLEAWEGPGSLQFHGDSDIDPWSRLAVKRLISAHYRKYDMVLPGGKVIKTYHGKKASR